jgi:hypothetical protein
LYCFSLPSVSTGGAALHISILDAAELIEISGGH